METKMIGKEINQFNKETKTIMLAVVLLVVGILFCFSLAMGINALSYIIGVCIIIAGGASILNTALTKKTTLNYSAIIGATIIALGILFIEYRLASILFSFVPWLLAVVGVIVVADAILKKLSQNNNVVFVTELIVGILILALGLCLKYIPGFMEFSSIMLGIIIIIYASYLLIMVFTKR